MMLTIFGLLLGVGAIFVGNLIEGGHPGALFQFAAALIVFGGTLGATIVSASKEDLRLAVELFTEMFNSKQEKPRKIFFEVVALARLARKEGILELEKYIGRIADPYLQSMIRHVVDGATPEQLESVFGPEIQIEEERLMGGANVWTEAGGYAPTIGILGAVLGLIHVMSNLSDTSQLGSGIAVAFVATIYGVGLSNLILIPLGQKLKRRIRQKVLIKEMMLDGCLGILQGLTPNSIEQKLSSYIDPNSDDQAA